MYEAAIATAKDHLFFRPMEPEYNDILISGNLYQNSLGHFVLEPQGQHLSCFVGGMMGIAAQMLSNDDDLILSRKLVDGCVWAYDQMPTGIMPELFYTVPCNNPRECIWDLKTWHRGIMGRNGNVNETNLEEMIDELRLPPGFTDIPDRRYILRYETSLCFIPSQANTL
jgi:mannosyl-oligosaccharide alpha-1,2-mannosidase